MRFIHRVWLSIIKQPIKSLLLFLLFFILGNVIVAGFSIQQATNSVKTDMMNLWGQRLP
ncbi:hypothetical protein [Amphibacillus sediminis]|uniref:hypothetical protein n=1 Tax=Amphibacillus sediminis TaxID=360185 RepID=UPI0012EDD672|nr:hypothetical protein [Amphibacillus sediminis]